jgi:hypothetical protein
VNAHQAAECRQGSIPELHRGQVSMSLENKQGTVSQWGEPWRPLDVETHKMSFRQPGPRAGVWRVLRRLGSRRGAYVFGMLRMRPKPLPGSPRQQRHALVRHPAGPEGGRREVAL